MLKKDMEMEKMAREVKLFIESKMDADVKIHVVNKNNGVNYTGIIIHRPNIEDDVRISPTIYLDLFLQDYIENKITVEEIANTVLKQYFDTRSSSQARAYSKIQDCLYEKEFILENCILKLISKNANKELLKEVPYIPFLDMVAIPLLMLSCDANGIGTIRVTKQLLKLSNVNEKQLLKQALKNTQKKLPVTITTMQNVIAQMLLENFSADASIEESEFNDLFSSVCQSQDDFPMYIATNKFGINGASVFLYDNMLKEFAQKINSNLVILPSSIHELIILPFNGECSADDLKDMVSSVNNKEVPTEEILSYNVYIYEKETEKISIME